MNKHFKTEDIQMDNSHMKRCSTLLPIMGMKIKTIMQNTGPYKRADNILLARTIYIYHYTSHMKHFSWNINW